MKKLDVKRPYGTVYGGRTSFVQDGIDFDAEGNEITDLPQESEQVETDDIDAAQTFLKTILANTSLSKSAVFKAAESNNQNWNDVKNAAAKMGIVKFKFSNVETWKLPEEA